MPFRRRSYGYRKPGLLTVNHCNGSQFSTVADTTSQRAEFTTVENADDRSADLPMGAVLREIDIQAWSIDGTPPNGRHECLMLFQPGGTTYSDPIAAWLNSTDPLTEEAIQVRQNIMVPYHRQQTITGISGPLRWRCRWTGNKILRDGDDVVVCFRDLLATSWDIYCVAKYIL